MTLDYMKTGLQENSKMSGEDEGVKTLLSVIVFFLHFFVSISGFSG